MLTKPMVALIIPDTTNSWPNYQYSTSRLTAQLHDPAPSVFNILKTVEQQLFKQLY